MATEIEQPLALTAVTPTAPSPTGSAIHHSATGSSDGTPGSASRPLPSPTSANGQANASRRPPRKSTLTQQQKNQKRQRATQDQLTTLEMEFNKNPTPTASVRDRIAEEINMTERSVQIWFQNRRAKIKMLAKKSLETGEDIDSIPESMRQYLAMQAMESGKGFAGSYMGRTGLLPFGGGNMLFGGDQSAQGKVLIHHLTCRSLSIGKWTRVGQNTMNLIIFYSPDKCTMTYYINNEQAGYKIEYPFSHIKNIWLENADNDMNKLAGIFIELNQPPYFMMDATSSTTGFDYVSDFTEDQQASQCLLHHLGGNPKVLANQLAKLVSLESFMNRHNPHSIRQVHAYADPHAISASAPQQWGMAQMHSAANMRPQGHKRQRSRSVPGPIDFAMFQNQPMPSFYIQPPGDMAAQHNPNIYAPVPQQPNVAHNLRIDTQAGFGLDMRQYPMSATTASPSEFPPSPGFFPPGQENGPLAPSNYSTPYGAAFLSPMVTAEANMPTAISPLPFNGPTEPSIVEQSPPMSMMGRPGSSEMYMGQDGSCAVSDDGVSLNEMYSKHSINMPLHEHSPGSYVQHSQGDIDMDQLVHFDAVDPTSLSPETMHR
ncbi:homeobox domain-containing protein [Trichoderma breve]|uniref:Homeobox domain-containing protein n=1 Tax=Trichoderma breve TaxID=2034170 RepID=A0A9W9EC71_9HYPO|nr:homeobox domain-containing protein [Trichoderma breve]KAJ4864010.1 homeobox domain-containing protein [Trichoderma breve]